jgi:heterodisulfide reductase subunit D
MNWDTPLEQMLQRTGVLRCLECGKCTAVCPVSHHDHRFSPRRTVGRALMRHEEALLTDDRLWACLTCLHCSQVCPAGVAYADLTLGVRSEAHKLGMAIACTHGEVIHLWMRMMMNPVLQQNRLRWLENGQMRKSPHGRQDRPAPRNPQPAARTSSPRLRTSTDSDTLYFVGCAPYFEAQFGHIGVEGDAVARATVQTLNALGIEPQVLADERCCGHDLLWEGDVDGFRKLAELNAALVRASGARRIVTSCPECARALKVDYPAHGIDLDVEVLYLAELLADQHISNLVDQQTDSLASTTSASHATGYAVHNTLRAARTSDGRPQARKIRVTYHDPCRLGRHLGIYDAPREVIGAVGLELVEMPRHRENALCCGTNGWTHCGAANANIQADRLREAQGTGASVLVTACLKCQIHFRCAMQNRELSSSVDIEIKDLATVIAQALG